MSAPLITPAMPTGPMVIPYCGICNQPVEVYHIKPKDQFRAALEGECCGKHMGAYITVEEMGRVQRTNDKFYLVVQPGKYQSVKGLSIRRADTVPQQPTVPMDMAIELAKRGFRIEV